MKKVMQSMSKYVFAGFGIAVLALLMTLTYSALGRLFPGNFANQMWGLTMFDIAAMCWALAFVFQSKSTGQYATSAIGFIVAFVGTLGMVAAEVMLSGQELANVDTVQIGRWMVYGFIAVTAIHAILVYAHHATAPEISEQINIGIARGEVVSRAIEDATKTIEAEKYELSRVIYSDIISQAKRDLGLIPARGTPFEPRQLEMDMVSLTPKNDNRALRAKLEAEHNQGVITDEAYEQLKAQLDMDEEDAQEARTSPLSNILESVKNKFTKKDKPTEPEQSNQP